MIRGRGEAEGNLTAVTTYRLVFRSIIFKSAANFFSNNAMSSVGIRTVLASITLFTIGSCMIYFGQVDLRFGTESNSRDRGLSMIIVGSLAFLPGSYAVIALFGAWRRWPGYSFETIPSYDD